MEYIVFRVEEKVKVGITDNHIKDELVIQRFITPKKAIAHIIHQCTWGEYIIIPLGNKKYQSQIVIIKTKEILYWGDKHTIIKKYIKEDK